MMPSMLTFDLSGLNSRIRLCGDNIKLQESRASVFECIEAFKAEVLI
jgi:hypothetical protein